MNISLNEKNILDAIRTYLSAQGMVLHDKTITAKFKNGRKGNGLSAEVSIESATKSAIITPLPVIAPIEKKPEPEEKVAEPVIEQPPVASMVEEIQRTEVAEAIQEEESQEKEAEEASAKAKSLFG